MICFSSSSFSTTMMTFLPSLMSEQRHLDEARVLVAVADDQAARSGFAAPSPANSSGLLPTSSPKL